VTAMRTPLLLAVTAGMLLGPRPLQAQVHYDVFRATISIPYVAQMTDTGGAKVLVNGLLTNAQFINLAQGRDPKAPVPKNQILVELNPDDYTVQNSARFAVFDTTTATVISNLTSVDEATSGFGKPGGNRFVLFARGHLLSDLTSANFAIGQTSVSGGAKGLERSKHNVDSITSKVVSMVGDLPLTIDGVAVPAVILKGRVRISGKAIASFDGAP
jgi:hypothetical protein